MAEHVITFGLRSDTFSQTDPFEGVDISEALNTAAFGLTTGHVPFNQATTVLTAAVDLLMAEQQTRDTLTGGSLLRPIARPRTVRHPFSGNAQGARVAPADALSDMLRVRGGVHDR